jgi:hypothetical protein
MTFFIGKNKGRKTIIVIASRVVNGFKIKPNQIYDFVMIWFGSKKIILIKIRFFKNQLRTI